MKFEFVVVFALIVCLTLAADSECKIPDNFCSVRATGSGEIDVTIAGSSSKGYKQVEVTMTRVKDSVRYDFYQKNSVRGSIIRVPYGNDGKTFGYLSIQGQSFQTCVSMDGVNLLKYFTRNETEKVTSPQYPGSAFFFDSDSHLLKREDLRLKWGDESTDLFFDMWYHTSVDYSFVSENENTFLIDEGIVEDACFGGGLSQYSMGIIAETDIVCGPEKTISTTMPCNFEYKMEMEENHMGTVKGIYQNGEGFLKAIDRDIEGGVERIDSTVQRCDIKNEKGECLVINRKFVDGYEKSCIEHYSGDSVLFPDLSYRGKAQPVNCPDDTPGCTQYCDIEYGNCFVINKDGTPVLVQEKRSVIRKKVVFTGREVSPDEFRVAHCDGTIIEVPEITPCSQQLSSASFSIPSSLLLIHHSLIHQ